MAGSRCVEWCKIHCIIASKKLPYYVLEKLLHHPVIHKYIGKHTTYLEEDVVHCNRYICVSKCMKIRSSHIHIHTHMHMVSCDIVWDYRQHHAFLETDKLTQLNYTWTTAILYFVLLSHVLQY